MISITRPQIQQRKVSLIAATEVVIKNTLTKFVKCFNPYICGTTLKGYGQAS